MIRLLDQRLLEAHEKGDQSELVALYTEAAEHAQDEEAQGFYLTHAYVYALELGDARVQALHARLISLGRDA